MRLRLTVTLLLFIILCTTFSFREKNEIKPAHIFHQMYDSIKSIKTIRQKVWAIERIEKKFGSNHSEVKIQTHPRKVYYRNPGKKIEVLYDAEVDPHKALVKAHVFPYMTVSLDPMGNLMRRNQHYSLNELGYEFIGKSIALTISKDKDGLNNFTYHGKVNKNGYNCHLLQYENKNYSYTKYTVGPKETATLISYKLCVNEYLLRNKNDLLNDFGYLQKGRTLLVPTLYSRKAVLYIDEKMMIPVALSLYDDAGLFESYEYSQIELNKPFKKNDFSKDNPEYDF